MRVPIRLSRPLGLEPTFAATLLWIVGFATMIALVMARRVSLLSFRVYARAGHHWLDAKPLYDPSTLEGYQYFPQAAIVFAPFAALDGAGGGIAWRLASTVVLATGLARAVRSVNTDRVGEAFLLASSLTIGISAGAIGNGQANLVLAGLALHLVGELGRRLWWRAAAVVTFGLVIKPLFLVLVLLVWAVWRPMRWRVPIAVACAAALPWLFADHGYVVAQYTACLHKLAVAADPPARYEDIRGLLASLGWVLPHEIATVVAACAALATLGACVLARRRLDERHAPLYVVGLGLAYLMLFNPRSQSTSYIMPTAIAATLATAHHRAGRPWAAASMGGIAALWTINYNIVPVIELWLKPLVCLVFLSALLHGLRPPPPTPHTTDG